MSSTVASPPVASSPIAPLSTKPSSSRVAQAFFRGRVLKEQPKSISNLLVPPSLSQSSSDTTTSSTSSTSSNGTGGRPSLATISRLVTRFKGQRKNGSNQKNGVDYIEHLNQEMDQLFDLINQSMAHNNGSQVNMMDLFRSWVTFPEGSQELFRDLNKNQINNSSFASSFLKESAIYIQQSGNGNSTGNGTGNATTTRFNNFFKQGKIKILRATDLSSSLSSSSLKSGRRGSISGIKPRLRSSSISRTNQSYILQQLGNQKDVSPYEIYYYPQGGHGGEMIQIPFEFQTLISTDKIKPDAEADRKILLAFINIVRKYYVDRLIQIIAQKIYYHCDQKTNITTKCSVVAVGSTTLTSNYDVTVSGVIYPNRIVRMFNQEFARYWRDYSSNVFDTNIYGSTFFVTVDMKGNGSQKIDPAYYQLYRSLKTSGQMIFYLPPEKILGQEYPDGLVAIQKSQLEWLIVKIFLHAQVYNIESLSSPLYQTIQQICIPFIQTMMGMEMRTGSGTNAQNHTRIAGNIFKTKFGEEVTMESVLKSYADKDATLKNYEESLLKIQASQLAYEAIYTQSLSEVREGVPTKPVQIREILNVLLTLIDDISMSNFYGSETYFCMATIYHVLGYVQNLGPFYLSRSDYIISAVENYIDILRYHSKLSSPDPEEAAYGIIKMSKYLYRIYNALGKVSASNASNAAKLGIWGRIMKELKGQHSFGTSTLWSELTSAYGISATTANQESILGLIGQVGRDIQGIAGGSA